jgi:hypothetical protein
MDRNEPSGIDQLQDRLYSRDHVPKQRDRRRLRPETKPVPESWEVIETEEEKEVPVKPRVDPMVKKQERSRSMLSMILVASFLFFSVSAAIAGYIFYKDVNEVSPQNIDIEINGPLAIAGGEELALQLSIVNRNAASLQSATLIVDYPEGTRSADGAQGEQQRYREDLGVIGSGKSKNVTVRSIMVGEEGDTREITITVEYRVEGSNAIFFKERTYSVIISSAPVALTVETMREISSGQEVAFTLRAVSNSTGVLRNVALAAEYPPGFTFTGSEPAPAGDTNVWRVGDLRPGESREFTVRGTIAGQDGDRRIFRFTTGTAESATDATIGTVFSRTESIVAISRPFLQVAIKVNGQSGTGDVTISQNRQAGVEIDLSNTLPDTLRDVEVTAKLSGSAFNMRGVSSRDGFFRSQDSSVVWNRQTLSTLGTMNAGARANLSFAILPVELDQFASLKNGEVMMDITVRARRVSESDVPEMIESTISRKVLVGTELGIAGETIYSVGPFENTGPIPPQVEQRTTYTLKITLTNSSNELRDTIVRMSLPWYVEWLGTISPQHADVRHNAVSGDLAWHVGSLPAGVGYDRQPLELYMQVAIEPSFGQLGQAPVLLMDQTVEGVDAFTGHVVQTSRRELTTRLLDDPVFTRVGPSSVVVE